MSSGAGREAPPLAWRLRVLYGVGQLPEGVKTAAFGFFLLFYFNQVLPVFASLFSRKSAYVYLPESVHHFPDRVDFKNLLRSEGFNEVTHRDLTFGITTIYTGKKV